MSFMMQLSFTLWMIGEDDLKWISSMTVVTIAKAFMHESEELYVKVCRYSQERLKELSSFMNSIQGRGSGGDYINEAMIDCDDDENVPPNLLALRRDISRCFVIAYANHKTCLDPMASALLSNSPAEDMMTWNQAAGLKTQYREIAKS
jgi:hypothetical protein